MDSSGLTNLEESVARTRKRNLRKRIPNEVGPVRGQGNRVNTGSGCTGFER